MDTFNNDTIKRFAERLEEQAANFQVTTENIDYDFRNIAAILNKYTFSSIDSSRFTQKASDGSRVYTQPGMITSNVHSLGDQANNFGDGWMTTNVTLKDQIISIAAAMLEFYNFSTQTIETASGAISALNNKMNNLAQGFSDYYAQNGVERDKSDFCWNAQLQAGWGLGRPNYGKHNVAWETFDGGASTANWQTFGFNPSTGETKY